MTSQIRVLIVDRQLRTRQSLRALLATWPEIGEIREATSGIEAVQLMASYCADLVFMGMRLPDLEELEATRLIKKRWARVKIIVLSSYADYEADALAAGADAFVHKGEPPDRLMEALAAVMSRSANVVPCRD